MSEIQDDTTLAQAEELDDFDVEGHGLREVALVMGAASAIAGGASAAIAMDNPAPGTARGAHAVIAGVQADVNERTAWADRTAAGVVRDAGTTVDGAQQLADSTVDGTHRLADSTVDSALTAVRPIGDQATRLANDPIGESDRLADQAVTDVRGVRDGALQTANQQVDGATRLANDTVREAGSTVGGTARTADRTAADAVRTVNPSVEAETGDDGTTVKVGVADKSVTVSTR